MTIVFNGGGPRTVGDSVTLSQSINRGQNIQNESKLSGRELKRVPEHIRKNVALKILDLSNNCLDDNSICDLSDLRNLIRLNLSANELKNIPLDFSIFPFLEVLCLSANELDYLPDGVTNLHRLKRLHCDFNRLKCLPLDWSSLVSLTTLTLSNNRLEEIPTTVWTLQSLQKLNLNRNHICGIGPLPEAAAGRLKELNLSKNRISGFLDLSLLSSLVRLDISHNEVEDLEVLKLSRLESLMVSQNALKSLHLDGTKLRILRADVNDLESIKCKHLPTHLETLDISHNNMMSLPDWISEAKSMTHMCASHNQITSLPKQLFASSSLRNLQVTHNLLNDLPEMLTPCHIRTLCLQYNKIQSLPDNFFLALPCLEVLNLSYNCLSCLPQSYGTNKNLRRIILTGNQVKNLNDLSSLLSSSAVETLHLAYNGIQELPTEFFSNVPALVSLSLSGNGIENVTSQTANAQNLKKLYLHSNQITSVPWFKNSSKLEVLDLACNKLKNLELASIVPKGLTYLDLSSNCDLQIDPTDFQHLCCQRPVAVVDVNCAGRQAPLTDCVLKDVEDVVSPWLLGFTESQDGNTRLYIEFQKDPTSGQQEALIALMEVDDLVEVAQLRSVLPELLKAEKECKETYPLYLKNSLIACVRYLRSRGYYKELGITMCHLSSSSSNPVTLRLGTIGRPSSCILGRAGNVIVLAQRQDPPPFEIEEWQIAMEDTEVCCNNCLNILQNQPAPKGIWTSIPDPEVRELILSPQDKFLVFGDSAFSRTVPADEVCRQVQNTTSPVAAGKALSEMYSALTDGRRECIAVIMFKSDMPHNEEEVEKYRCWEFMLEQNHKLLFTKELETIHKTILHNGEPRPTSADPPSWYKDAFSKYKCPLPSHRGRYYCYGGKME
ncbi:PH domain leucine-rich repeat-containing protein phosphatase 1-like [Uloborus diversus]|uniref:PH domain leucine-rich repeat-containing protein phosphatase 1-like n=1 Tax=Uloborus diversus TaxID=327109 RepID=UPI002409FA58|nr:PH domain leucine-rich repeat-containing protein phosphatase 1-like [Uloborus diversus]